MNWGVFFLVLLGILASLLVGVAVGRVLVWIDDRFGVVWFLVSVSVAVSLIVAAVVGVIA